MQPLKPGHEKVLTELVDSVTSEVGRAVVGLTFIQLAIKAICPEQSIRLHKGGSRRAESFSWADGIPMRVLDKSYFTPFLRRNGLLRINADGVFMTRSLAENYPYSRLYKAALRGARDQWLMLTDLIERGDLDALCALKHLTIKLINRSESFNALATEALALCDSKLNATRSIKDFSASILSYVDGATYSARLFEIALHAFFQALEDLDLVEGTIKPLSQMRSANKKHGNVGDIEILPRKNSPEILEAWDAKYGKPYLRDELEELSDKLADHSETKTAGFVVNSKPDLRPDIKQRIQELEDMYSCSIQILDFSSFVETISKRENASEDDLAKAWLIALVESLCQKRRDRAPIDEPSDVWVAELIKYLKQLKTNSTASKPTK